MRKSIKLARSWEAQSDKQGATIPRTGSGSKSSAAATLTTWLESRRKRFSREDLRHFQKIRECDAFQGKTYIYINYRWFILSTTNTDFEITMYVLDLINHSVPPTSVFLKITNLSFSPHFTTTTLVQSLSIWPIQMSSDQQTESSLSCHSIP